LIGAVNSRIKACIRSWATNRQILMTSRDGGVSAAGRYSHRIQRLQSKRLHHQHLSEGADGYLQVRHFARPSSRSNAMALKRHFPEAALYSERGRKPRRDGSFTSWMWMSHTATTSFGMKNARCSLHPHLTVNMVMPRTDSRARSAPAVAVADGRVSPLFLALSRLIRPILLSGRILTRSISGG